MSTVLHRRGLRRANSFRLGGSRPPKVFLAAKTERAHIPLVKMCRISTRTWQAIVFVITLP
jgi:hypothetical protein